MIPGFRIPRFKTLWPKTAWLRTLRSDHRGAVAVMAAVGGGLACLCAAVAVDLGAVALEARRLQGTADLAALSAARDLDRHTAAATATARDNLGEGLEIVAQAGTWVADSGRAPDARFTPGGARPNAARVTLSRPVRLVFGHWLLGRDTVRLSRSATAMRPVAEPLATFSIGSRLARLDGGLANALLQGLTGSRVSLTVMDYRALADADVELLGYLDALSLDLGLTAGNYDALLQREVKAGRLLGVMETLVGPQAGSVLNRLSRAADGLTVKVGDLIGLEADTPDALDAGLATRVSALDLAFAMIEVGAGDRQMRLDLGVPTGLADLKAWLAIGEPPASSPRLTVTGTGEPRIRTAQARLYLRATTAESLSGLARVELPILIELAPAEAVLRRIDCGAAPAATLGVRPGIARVRIGRIDETRLDDFKTDLAPSTATLLSVLGLVRITARADVRLEPEQDTPVLFQADEIARQDMKTVTAKAWAGGLVGRALTKLDVDVQLLGLGLGLGNLTSALFQLLAPLGPVLDGVVDPLLGLLGLKLGEADVTVHHLTCPGDATASPRLVG